MFLQSLLIGILYFFCRWNPSYTSWLEASCTPMFLSVIIGFIMGDVTSAVIVGAYVQTVYLGLITGLGGVATVDKSLGSCIIIPLAVASGMSPELAVSMAIPFGLLGTLTINLPPAGATKLLKKETLPSSGGFIWDMPPDSGVFLVLFQLL